MFIVRGINFIGKLASLAQKGWEVKENLNKSNRTLRDNVTVALQITCIANNVRGSVRSLMYTDDPQKTSIAVETAVLEVAQAISSGQGTKEVLATTAMQVNTVCSTLLETKSLCKNNPTDTCTSTDPKVKCSHATTLTKYSDRAATVSAILVVDSLIDYVNHKQTPQPQLSNPMLATPEKDDKKEREEKFKESVKEAHDNFGNGSQLSPEIKAQLDQQFEEDPLLKSYLSLKMREKQKV